MNYLQISKDLIDEDIAHIKINIGNNYTLGVDSNNKTQNVEALLSDLLFNIDGFNEVISFKDNNTGTMFRNNLEGIKRYIEQEQNNRYNTKQEEALNIELIPLSFQEQLWKYLVNKYEYLRSDIEGNFNKFKEAISWIMECICNQYQQDYLKNNDYNDINMQFSYYMEHIMETIDSIIRRKNELNDDYFQKRFYSLKEELLVQEKELSALLKLSPDTTMNEICDKIEKQQSSLCKSIFHVANNLDGLKGLSDLNKIDEVLENSKNELSSILNNIGLSSYKNKNKVRPVNIDGYFLPFHRIRTKRSIYHSRVSPRSASLQNSRNIYSEKMSYNSLSEQIINDTSNNQSHAKNLKTHKGLKRNHSDYSLHEGGILEDSKDNVDSIHEANSAELEELKKLKQILSEIGFSQEDFEDTELLNSKIDNIIKINDEKNELIRRCRQLENDLNIKNHNEYENDSKYHNYYTDIIKKLENQLIESERHLEGMYEENASKENDLNVLQNRCEELQVDIHKLKIEIEQKENINRALLTKNDTIIYELQTLITPRLRIYKSEIEELKNLMTDGYIQNLMVMYKKLKDKKLELSDEGIEYLKSKCEQFVNELELTAKNARGSSSEINLSEKNKKLRNHLNNMKNEKYDKVIMTLENKLEALRNKVVKQLIGMNTYSKKLANENKWILDELELNKKETDDIILEHNINMESMRTEYKEIIATLNKELEDKSDNINNLQDELDNLKNNENNKTETDKNIINELKDHLESKEKDIKSLRNIIDELRVTLEHRSENKNIKDSNNEVTTIEDELERVNIMNSKLVGEVEILSKRNQKLKEEVDLLTKKIYNQEDLKEHLEELTLSNKILENKVELLESYKLTGENTKPKKTGDIANDDQNVQFKSEIDNCYIEDSIKDSNKTITEVEEGLEKSDIDQSLDITKFRNYTLGQSQNRDTNFSHHKDKDIKKSVFLSTTINLNYSYVYKKDEENKELNSPKESPVKRHIFSADSIMKNIEALKRSSSSYKDDNMKKSTYKISTFKPERTQKTDKIGRIKELLNVFISDIDKMIPVDRVNSLEKKVNHLQTIIVENDIESLEKPKRDSNLKALTPYSKSSKDDTYYIETNDFENNEIERSEPKKNNQNYEKVDNLNNKERKYFNTKVNKKKNPRLEQLTKMQNYTSPKKRIHDRLDKKLNLKQPKPLSISNKSHKKNLKGYEIGVESLDKNTYDEWKKIEEELLRNNHDLQLENRKLSDEINQLNDKSIKNENILQQTFEIAIKLVDDQIEDSSDLNYSYLDQIMDIIKTKVLRYEDALELLQQEIGALKEEYREYQREEEHNIKNTENNNEDHSLREVDLQQRQVKEQLTYSENNKQTNEMKNAFDDLMCEMFTLITDNIDTITNFEDIIAEENNEDNYILEKMSKEDMSNEIEKIKTYMVKTKEMIEVLYENLMNYIDENEADKPQNTINNDKQDMNGLKEENEYLYKKLSTFNDNYQELNKKYIELLGEKNALFKHSSSTPDLEYNMDNEEHDSLKNKMKQFIQNNSHLINNAHDMQQDDLDKQDEDKCHMTEETNKIYQLTNLLRRINRIIKSDNENDHKITKIEDILENPETQ